MFSSKGLGKLVGAIFFQVQALATSLSYHNLNITFAIKCEVQGPMRTRMCLGVKKTFKSEGKCKGWNPMTPKCAPILGLHLCGSYECLESWLKRQINTKLSPQNTIKKFLKCRCSKCPCIFHLDVICMNYDEKKGWESNWKFDSQPQIPERNQMRSNWGVLYTVEKIFLRATKYCPCIFKKIWFKKIWASQVLGQQKSQFWDSYLGVPKKVTFGCNPCEEPHSIL